MHAALAAKNNNHVTQQNPVSSRRTHSRWKATYSIAQIRKDINQQVTPASWVVSATSISGVRPSSPRPSPHSIQQSLPSNKKRKPD